MAHRLMSIESLPLPGHCVAPLGGEPLDPAELGRFVFAMAQQGWPTALARMVYDPIYARERIALAHTSADAALRDLAVRLFRCYAPAQTTLS
jgi:hypothetical protein